ncbi:hypothetical protein TRFO_27047 [Tritrichomonas foetus]|uniref:Uncharacterized protein n=1 Tax=Tritrichomonas foetus TaxID=1144522 RepID=A0A1J4K1G7_9EUKA|nr:hypothetical protein TRFO_27047 [Tritrichomonas foetus]|eukprot:OHT05281.1 hypothetical protein TRFO_27047 [Tritrichomonas foetus]
MSEFNRDNLRSQQNTNIPSRFLFSTDFCLYGLKLRRKPQDPLNLPKSYMFNQIVNQDEFMLGENLNVANKKRVELVPNKSRVSKTKTPSEGSKLSSHSSQFKEVPPTTNAKLSGTILTPQEVASATFHESALREYISSSSTAFDHAIRPLFDPSGFFPYDPTLSTSNRVVIRTSRIAFHTKYIGFPLQSIERLSVFMTLVRASRCVSNIIEVPMCLNKSGTWRPLTFHQFDWIIESDAEVALYVEVVVYVRVPSNRKPFSIKSSLIAENSMSFIEFRKGGFHPIQDNKLRLLLNRDGEIPLDGQEAVLSFHVSRHQMKHPGLPENFICPSDAAKIYETMRIAMMRLLDPFFGNFTLWNPLILEPVMFGKIARSDKSLFALISAWADKSEESLRDKIRLIYPSTNVMSKTGPFCLLANADTPEKATLRVANGLLNRVMVTDENIKPFHTDELRRRLVLSIPAVFE